MLKGNLGPSDIAKKYGVFPTQVNDWKKKAIEGIRAIFADSRQNNELKEKDKLIEELYQQIGKLTVERDWLKKNNQIPDD